MKIVIIGSNNPVKAAVTKKAFTLSFPNEAFTYITCTAQSGVSAQPFGIGETRLGALNRATHCQVLHPEGDFFVGLEGGIELIDSEYWVSAWMCVSDNNGQLGYGRTSAFLLPQIMATHLRSGAQLSEAGDQVFGVHNSGYNNGTVGLLTGDLITRQDFYLDALIFALIPFKNPSLYRQ